MNQTPCGQSVCAPSGKLQWVGRQRRCLPQPQEHNRTGRDPGDKGEGRGCAAPRAIRVLWVHYHCKATCGYSSPCPMGSAHGHRLCCETPGQSAAPPPHQHHAGLGCRYLGLHAIHAHALLCIQRSELPFPEAGCADHHLHHTEHSFSIVQRYNRCSRGMLTDTWQQLMHKGAGQPTAHTAICGLEPPQLPTTPTSRYVTSRFLQLQ